MGYCGLGLQSKLAMNYVHEKERQSSEMCVGLCLRHAALFPLDSHSPAA